MPKDARIGYKQLVHGAPNGDLSQELGTDRPRDERGGGRGIAP